MSENDFNSDSEVKENVEDKEKEERDRKRREDREKRHRQREERERERDMERDRDRDRDRGKERDRDREKGRDRSYRRRDGEDTSWKERNEDKNREPKPKKKKITEEEENLLTRTGGAYIPPAKLRLLQSQITDKTSIAFQRIAWEALKKSLNGLINKVNVSNVSIIIRELFRENVVRGRGLLARSILQAQAASPTFTHVYACFVSVINSKFHQIGALILKRLIIQFRLGFRRNDKQLCLSSTRFIAHLVNQLVVHELVALEILTLLLETPTDDAVEVAIGFLKECGMKLSEVTPRGMNAVFERLRSILHEGNLDKRVQYMIEVMFAIWKDKFIDHPTVILDLDLVEESEQFTHLIKLDEVLDAENMLNVFKHDPEYEENEEKYKAIRKDILDEVSDDESGDNEGGSEDEESDDEDDEEQEEKDKIIIDNTETNLVSLRRTIYLTIQSSLDFEECAHKLLKMELKPGQEVELCHMILDCCAQQRTYEKFFGLLGQRFCQLNKIYVTPFEEIFRDSYDTIHRLETNKLRNVAKFFSHLLYTDAINWMVLAHIRLNEEDTTSSSRIFIKILFQELSEYMGLPRLNERLKDASLQEAFEGLFPRDNPRNSRFAINFFTSIGLGGLTDELREHLKTQSKPAPTPAQPTEIEVSSPSVEEASSEEETSDSSSSSRSSESSDSEPDIPVSKRRKSKSKKSSKHTKSSKKEKESKSKSKHKKDRHMSPEIEVSHHQKSKEKVRKNEKKKRERDVSPVSRKRDVSPVSRKRHHR